VTGVPWADNLSDWLYQHSTEFHSVLIIAIVLTVVAGLAAVFRRSLLKLALIVVLPDVAAIGVVLVADAVAAKSSANDIARRVHDVATTLPPTATRSAVQVGGNFEGEMYQVPGEIAAVSRVSKAQCVQPLTVPVPLASTVEGLGSARGPSPCPSSLEVAATAASM
jgi:hypothetical protein